MVCHGQNPPLSPAIPGYLIEGCLSRTNRSIVYRGREEPTNALVAIKVSAATLDSEIEIHSQIDHDAILTPITAFQLEGGLSALVFPYAAGGDLFEIVVNSPLSEETARLVFFRVAGALQALHEQSIWHRDVKLENILMMRKGDPESAVLADFGFARLFPNGVCYEGGPGSRRYAAPEILLQSPYTAKVDVWSLGVTIFAAMTGRFPAGDRSLVAEVLGGMRGLWQDPDFMGMSYDLKELLKGMLDTEATRRLSMKEVLAHHWFAPARKRYLSAESCCRDHFVEDECYICSQVM
jgi:serine/threonine-protein kinase ULK/ATG1